MEITGETISILIAIMLAIVAIATYFANKYGKVTQTKVDQMDRDSKQDNRLTTVENSNEALGKKVDEHHEDIKELKSNTAQIGVLNNKVETLIKQSDEVGSDIKEIFKILRNGAG